jgi:hypothetical protein
MPVGCAVFVYLRGWTSALVFAATRISGNSASGVHAGDAATGIFNGQVLRAKMYSIVRAADRDFGQLA